MRKLAMLAMVCSTTVAVAQDQGINVQRFTPAPGGSLNFNQVEGAGVVGGFRPTFGLWVNYAHQPLVATNPGWDTSPVLLKQDAALDALVGIGLGSRLQLGLAIPFTFMQKAGDTEPLSPAAVSGSTLGDLRVVPKVALVNSKSLGLSLSVPVYIPTGSPENYHGEAGLAFEPRLIVEIRPGDRLKVGANLSYAVRKPQTYYTLETGSELRYGLGLAYALVPQRFSLLAEAFGGADLANLAINTAPFEANLAGRLEFGGGHSITLGGGPGITIGYGTPTFRAFLGYGFVPKAKAARPDKDGDGIYDDVDQCPAEPEDLDRFQDADGCPDPDNDQDGILDTADKCPNDPEDKDNFEDADGCPDPDNDQDGVKDADDKCPTEKEDLDKFEDKDGCPDPDNDKDNFLDTVDKCPNEPEDMDGLGDEDGCPEPDFDKDGILDTVDKCPRKPETINGNQDEDGCPDEGKAKVEVKAGKIEIIEKIYFALDSAEIEKRSIPVLKQVVSVMKANTQITRLRIEGHTDNQATDEYNDRLSQARVDSVKKYLVENGIDESRLEAQGFGEHKPIASNDTEAGRAKNRRVEFVILEIDGKPNPDLEKDGGTTIK